MNKFIKTIHEETRGLLPRLELARLIMVFIPRQTGFRLRSAILRKMGFKIGYGTLIAGRPNISGIGDIYSRLEIGKHCFINVGCYLDLSGEIWIGNNVSIGQEVMLLTHTHKIGTWEQRAGALVARSVHVGDGAWLGARSLILPGVSIGSGAIVAAGAVVTKDVPANSLVGGIPAVKIRQLDNFQGIHE